ncbi:MAG: metallophosphoesterase [Clostridia bacterium]|nr:metallophosphoesterase [Clostridia bacterium]
MIYTISDPHLSFSTDKPMDIFGSRWDNHAEKFETEWKKVVKDTDTVVIPGDISWASSFEQVYEDLKFINDLPGKKLIGKGNHDYWWATMNKLTNFKEEKKLSTIDFLFNNAYAVENKIICGTRGWVNEFGVKSEDERLIKREAARLEISLNEGMKLKEQYPDNEMIVFLHYPPIFGEFMNLDILDILYRFDITKVYFGHLHNVREEQLDKEYIGIKLNLVACDYVDFVPRLVQ